MQNMFIFVHSFIVACHFSYDKLEIFLIVYSSEFGI